MTHDSQKPLHSLARGLTLIEMVVAVGLLVVVILGIGLVFHGAAGAVGTSEKTLDMLSNVRSVQWQLEQDLQGIDKNCFLVIRSAAFSDSANGYHRCDMITFVSHGSFAHRTGALTATPFTDDAPVANSAVITWNQLALARTGGSNGSGSPTVFLDSSDQTTAVPLNQVPNGIIVDEYGNVNDGGMILGRNALLLFPKNTATLNVEVKNGLYVGAFQNNPQTAISAIDWSTGLSDAAAPDGVGSHITQSRVDVAATTPSQIMSYLMQNIGTNRNSLPRYEADHFCFRHAAVKSPYDGIGGNFVNGYFRMHPIALPGVSSFAIDWTDGTAYGGSETDPSTGVQVKSEYIGTTRWYGMGAPKVSGANVEPLGANSGTMNGDAYCANFTYDTPRFMWPVALRFRYHVSDSTGRLPGGRDFVQVVKLPN